MATKQFEIQGYSPKEIEDKQLAVRMVDIGVSEKSMELILQSLAAYKVMGGNFDLMTAAKIIAHVNKKYDKPDETEKHP